jgi:hypothetical protein
MATSLKANSEGKVNTETSVAIPQSTDVVPVDTNTSGFKVGTVSGPVRKTDFKPPTLHIVHNTGSLQENFEPGSLVLNKEVVLTTGGDEGKPIKITVVAFKKYFMEKLEFGKSEAMPRIFDDENALAAAGLHTNWVGQTPPPAIEAGDALLAIESDEEHAYFPFGFNGKHYTLAIWRIQSPSAYSRAGKLIVTASEWNLKDGLHNGSWTLTTRKEKLGKNWVQCPVLKAGPRNPKDLADFFTSLI